MEITDGTVTSEAALPAEFMPLYEKGELKEFSLLRVTSVNVMGHGEAKCACAHVAGAARALGGHV